MNMKAVKKIEKRDKSEDPFKQKPYVKPEYEPGEEPDKPAVIMDPERMDVLFNVIHNELFEERFGKLMNELGYEKTDRTYQIDQNMTHIQFNQFSSRKTKG